MTPADVITWVVYGICCAVTGGIFVLTWYGYTKEDLHVEDDTELVQDIVDCMTLDVCRLQVLAKENGTVDSPAHNRMVGQRLEIIEELKERLNN